MSGTRLVADPPLRARPRDGHPRCTAEVVLQWLWRNRVTVMLVWIVVAVTIPILVDLAPR